MRVNFHKAVPEPARPGLRLAHLTFTPHPMADELTERIDMTDRRITDLLPTLQAMMTAKQAVVIFANGWGLSLCTCRPGPGGLLVVHGDERRPTYEVAVFDPDHHIDAIYNHQTVDDVEALFGEIMSRDYVGVINLLHPLPRGEHKA